MSIRIVKLVKRLAIDSFFVLSGFLTFPIVAQGKYVDVLPYGCEFGPCIPNPELVFYKKTTIALVILSGMAFLLIWLARHRNKKVKLAWLILPLLFLILFVIIYFSIDKFILVPEFIYN